MTVITEHYAPEKDCVEVAHSAAGAVSGCLSALVAREQASITDGFNCVSEVASWTRGDAIRVGLVEARQTTGAALQAAAFETGRLAWQTTVVFQVRIVQWRALETAERKA